MSVCTEFEALLDLFLDGELSPDQMSAVADHLETCPACQAYVDDGLAIRAAFPEMAYEVLPEDFEERVLEAIRSVPQETPLRRVNLCRWVRVLAPIAACFALVAVLRSLPMGGGGGAMENAAVTASAGADVPAGAEVPVDGEIAADTSAPESEEGRKTAASPVAPGDGAPAAMYDGYAGQAAPEAACGSLPEADAGPSAPAGAPEEDAAEFNREKENSPSPSPSPWDQADLLAEFVPRRDEDGETAYALTREEFQRFAASLEERGLPVELPEELPEMVWVYVE